MTEQAKEEGQVAFEVFHNAVGSTWTWELSAKKEPKYTNAWAAVEHALKPQVPSIEGKTPGQVLFEQEYSVRNWSELTESMRAFYERTAYQFLAAMGEKE